LGSLHKTAHVLIAISNMFKQPPWELRYLPHLKDNLFPPMSQSGESKNPHRRFWLGTWPCRRGKPRFICGCRLQEVVPWAWGVEREQFFVGGATTQDHFCPPTAAPLPQPPLPLGMLGVQLNPSCLCDNGVSCWRPRLHTQPPPPTPTPPFSPLCAEKLIDLALEAAIVPAAGCTAPFPTRPGKTPT
jgi:hypothetical protein